jgi:hypothetical protein
VARVGSPAPGVERAIERIELRVEGAAAIAGAVSGLGIGIAQWPLLYDRMRASAVWIPAIASLWALGWTVSTGIGVDLTTQRWAVFGISGALTVALLSGALLWLLRHESSAAPKAVPA